MAIYNPLEHFFSIAVIFTLIISSVFYVSNGRKKELMEEKVLLYSFASFWLSMAAIRTFFYVSDNLLEGTYIGDLDLIFLTYDLGNYIVLYFYLYLFIYAFINIIILCLMFIWFSLKSKKEFQTVSSIVTVGFALVLVGWAFESMIIKALNIISPIFPLIFILIGSIFAVVPLLVDIDFFSNRITNWLVLALIVGILVYLGLTVFTNLPLYMIGQVLLTISAILLVVALNYIIILIIRRKKLPVITESIEKRSLEDFIKAFTRPTSISYDEIETAREKRLCLVCKSRISFLNYTCPKCKTLYCTKCSEALSKLENVCWVCDTIIDKFAPTRNKDKPTK